MIDYPPLTTLAPTFTKRVVGERVSQYPSFDGSQLCSQADPEAWFPETPFAPETKLAKAICGGCHYQVACLEYALHHLVDGIWGGTSVTERRKMRRARQIKATPMYLTVTPPTQEALRARERRARKEPQ